MRSHEATLGKWLSSTSRDSGRSIGLRARGGSGYRQSSPAHHADQDRQDHDHEAEQAAARGVPSGGPAWRTDDGPRIGARLGQRHGSDLLGSHGPWWSGRGYRSGRCGGDQRYGAPTGDHGDGATTGTDDRRRDGVSVHGPTRRGWQHGQRPSTVHDPIHDRKRCGRQGRRHGRGLGGRRAAPRNRRHRRFQRNVGAAKELPARPVCGAGCRRGPSGMAHTAIGLGQRRTKIGLHRRNLRIRRHSRRSRLP